MAQFQWTSQVWPWPSPHCLSWEQMLLSRSLMARDRPAAEGPQTTDNSPVIKACPFLSQARLRDGQNSAEDQRRAPSLWKGKSNFLQGTESQGSCSLSSTVHRRHEWDQINAFCHPCHSTQSRSVLCIFQYSVPPQLRSFKYLDIKGNCKAATLPGTSPLLLPPSHPQNHLFTMLVTFSSKRVNIDLDQFVVAFLPPLVDMVTFDTKNLHCCKNLHHQNPKGSRHRFLVQTLYKANTRFYCLSRYQKH